MQRVLGIETSSERGSVALVTRAEQGPIVVAEAHHLHPNEHAERCLPLVAELLASVSWDRRSLDRIAVGVGPGSFTGIRIGIALAHGLGLGLGIPTVGVGSLAAIAAAHEPEDRRVRMVVRDARREEFFVAAYDAAGRELLAPVVWPRADLATAITQWAGDRAFIVLGARIDGLECAETQAGGAPDAAQVALLGAELDPGLHPPHPEYARGPGADPQNLRPSPLLLPRQ